ncbi:hypothetical protein TRAPUB_8521 [Trametes pubescens]|uniref:Uncharacterized protein n=1 Tax=Trametes pubescens TaxID=154538 RepID=A0A1M2W522_TRAPU|nr:hypothetical protein TRAPUB_8521 [Trametes pubescens]
MSESGPMAGGGCVAIGSSASTVLPRTPAPGKSVSRCSARLSRPLDPVERPS